MKTKLSRGLTVLTVVILSTLFQSSKLQAQTLVGSQPVNIWNLTSTFAHVNVTLAGSGGSANFSTWVCAGCAWQLSTPEFSQASGTPGIDDLELFISVDATLNTSNTCTGAWPALNFVNGATSGCPSCFTQSPLNGISITNTYEATIQ